MFSRNASTALISAMWIAVASLARAGSIHVPGDLPTLGAAIAAAAPGDEIILSAGAYSGPFQITAKPLTIRGVGDALTTLTAPPGTPILSISQVSIGVVRLERLSIAGGRAADHGAGLRISSARVELRSCSIRDNVAHLDVGCAWCNPVDFFGGGVSILAGSEVTVSDSTVADNRVSQSFYAWGAAGSVRGGGMYVSASYLAMEDSTVERNEARGNDYPPPANQNSTYGFGAGIHAEAGSVLLLTRTRVMGNVITGDRCRGGHGAGVCSRNGAATLVGCMVIGNTSSAPYPSNRGGGLYIDGGTLQVTDCTLWRNIGATATAAEPGSACYVNSGTLAMRGTSVCGSGTQPILGNWIDQGGMTFTDFCIDCNDNGVADGTEIASGAAQDVNANLIPDDCECLGDLYVDDLVNGVDLGLLLANWGPTTTSSASRASDLNRDNAVDGIDLGLLLSNWGSCGN